MYGRSGHPFVVGQGNAALRVELYATLTPRAGDAQSRPAAETHGELRDGGRTFNTATHEMRTNRDAAITVRAPLGVPSLPLRLVTLNWLLRLTHNQFRRTASVSVGHQFDLIERNRVRGRLRPHLAGGGQSGR